MTYQQTIRRIVPYPVVGQEDDIGRKDQLTKQVEMRLVVTDDYPRTVEERADFCLLTPYENFTPGMPCVSITNREAL